MYKPPYIIQPSSLDFFGDKLHGTGKWTLHKTTHPYDSINHNVEEDFASYNFYEYVGKSVRTAEDVIRADSKLIRPEQYIPVPYPRKSFDQPHPTQETVDDLLQKEARKTILISLFGDVEKKRKMYVIERRGSRLDEEERKWIAAKEAFEKAEDEKAARHNAKEKAKQDAANIKVQEYNNEHSLNELFLYASPEEVENMLKWIDPFFPHDFTMFIKYVVYIIAIISIIDLVYSVYREYSLYAIDNVFSVYTVFVEYSVYIVFIADNIHIVDIVIVVYTVASVNAVYTYIVANAATRYVVDIVAIVFSAYN